MGTELELQRAADGTPLMPGRNGGVLRAGGGRPLDPVKQALRRARRELGRSLDTLVAIRDNAELDAEKRIKAAVAIFQLSGVLREKPVPRKRLTLSVVRATPTEQAAKVAASDSSGPRSQTSP
jgi:hypothetical protein